MSGTLPGELGPAHQVATLAEAGVLAMSLAEFDGLPAPLAAQIDLVVGAKIKRQNAEMKKRQGQTNARKFIR